MAFDENVPVAANQISVDLPAMNANWEFLISGDGTAGRVLRRTKITIQNGSDADTIKCAGVDVWNGDTLAEEDNLGGGGDTGNFSLDAGQDTLTIEAGGLTGNAVAVLNAQLSFNSTATAITVEGKAVTNDIVLYFYNATSGAAYDLCAAVDGPGAVNVYVLYLTDA